MRDECKEEFDKWLQKWIQEDPLDEWLAGKSWRASWKAARASQWRPISEAPKDGTSIIIFSDSIQVALWGKSSTGEYGWLHMNDCWTADHMPTHWMPLPQPPEVQG